MLGRRTNKWAKVLCVCLISLISVQANGQMQEALFRPKPDKPAAVADPVVKRDLFANRIYTPLSEEKRTFVWRWFNSTSYSRQRSVDYDRRKLRQEWTNALGIDIFYPYFKVQEIKESVQNRTKVEFFHMRGRAEFDEDSKQFKYIFKRKF